MTPGLCIWEMHTTILLIILNEVTKYNNNMPESAILAASAATPIQMMKVCEVMTHKYRGSIIVLSISKSAEPNKEQKEMTSGFQQGILNKH